MSLDFSFFLNQSTLIFFLLLFVILIIFSITCFFVIKAIFKFIKSLFKKEPKEFEMKTVMSDKGEDLEVNVEQLEKSKEETAKIQKQTQQTFNVKYTQPIADNETKTPDKEPEKSSEAKQQWSDKEKQDIDAGLGKLKGEEGAGEKKSFLERQSMGQDSSVKPKISIPVSKKQEQLTSKEAIKENSKLSDVIGKEKQEISAGLGKLKGEEGSGEKNSFLERQSMGQDSSVKPKISIPVSKKQEQLTSKEAIKENSKLSDVIGKEYNKKDYQIKSEESSFFKKPEFIKKGAKLAPDKNKKEGVPNKKDSSIFGGKEEISRSELRTKLFGDASVAKAQRELYMNLSPVERAKLEKSVFKSSYGLNISKTDLKANLKKMGREWASTSDIKKKETLRKQIKFFKKIGGIK